MTIEYLVWLIVIKVGRYGNVGEIVLQVDLPGVAELLRECFRVPIYPTSYTRSSLTRLIREEVMTLFDGKWMVKVHSRTTSLDKIYMVWYNFVSLWRSIGVFPSGTDYAYNLTSSGVGPTGSSEAARLHYLVSPSLFPLESTDLMEHPQLIRRESPNYRME
jgi:hypothetical protein